MIPAGWDVWTFAPMLALGNNFQDEELSDRVCVSTLVSYRSYQESFCVAQRDASLLAVRYDRSMTVGAPQSIV